MAVLGTSRNNISELTKVMTMRTIGYDKINQLRHAKYFGSYEGLLEHMNKHKKLLAPKFNAVTEILEKEIAPLEIGSWTKPEADTLSLLIHSPAVQRESLHCAKTPE